MKTLLLIASLLLKTHIDTIDTWQVFQNKKQIASYFENDVNPILIINRLQIKSDDIFTISYFRDTPCSECPTHLYIMNDANKVFKTISSKGTFTPFKFSLTDLLKNGNSYLFYRAEDTREHRRLLFKLVIK